MSYQQPQSNIQANEKIIFGILDPLFDEFSEFERMAVARSINRYRGAHDDYEDHAPDKFVVSLDPLDY